MEIFSEEIKTSKCSIFFLFDIHQGNANHNNAAFVEAIKFIKNAKTNRDVITVLGGDMCDCIIPGDPRFCASEISKEYHLSDLKDLPRKQYQNLYKDLEPIADTIKYSLIGNHEEKYVKHNGFDVYDYLCTDLLRGCKKIGYEGILKFSFNCNKKIKSIQIALTHGTGGGGYREGYPLNLITDLFRKYDVDVHVCGHIHKLIVHDFGYLLVGNNGCLKNRVKWYGVGGCFLDTYRVGSRNYFEGHRGMLSEIGFLELSVQKRGDNWDYILIKHTWRGGRYE